MWHSVNSSDVVIWPFVVVEVVVEVVIVLEVVVEAVGVATTLLLGDQNRQSMYLNMYLYFNPYPPQRIPIGSDP